MLVLSRLVGEEIIIGDGIRVVIVAVRGEKVRVGITAPKDVPVHRKEVADAIAREKQDRQA
jgi:carbon storage regulator